MLAHEVKYRLSTAVRDRHAFVTTFNYMIAGAELDFFFEVRMPHTFLSNASHGFVYRFGLLIVVYGVDFRTCQNML